MLVNPIILHYIAGAYRVHCPILNRSIWPTRSLFRSEALRSIKVEFRDIVRDKFDVKHPSLIIKNLRKIICQIMDFFYLSSTNFFTLSLPFPSDYVFLLSFFYRFLSPNFTLWFIIFSFSFRINFALRSIHWAASVNFLQIS